MTKAGVDQATLAARSGIDQASISKYVNDKVVPRPMTVERLRDAIGDDDGYLLSGYLNLKTAPDPAPRDTKAFLKFMDVRIEELERLMDEVRSHLGLDTTHKDA